MILPVEARPLLEALAPVFTTPTFARFVNLLGSAILCTGRRTVADLLRIAAPLAEGHRTTYQRVLSSAEWSALRLACQLSRLVLALIPAGQPVILVGDDTVDGHPGRKVYGKARHRDPVRSSHGYPAWRYGHEWVVLAVLVRPPWADRPWALPVLVDLYRSEEDDRERRRPHRTPARIMATLLRVMLTWFPGRRFVFVGDSGYGTHEMARFAHRHRARLSLVSELHPEATLFEPPPPYRGNGRPPVKGPRRPEPKQAAAGATLQTETVAWYGGGRREVGVATGTGHWYKAGEGLVPIVWVFVKDRSGTHRDEYFFSTDPTMTAVAMIEAYAGRRNLETTFQEARCCLGLESTRGWCRRTVLRAAPCLFGLYTVVALLHRELPESKRVGRVEWPGKTGVTSSDALTSVRRWLWRGWVLPQAGGGVAVEQLPESFHKILFYALAPAAELQALCIS
jgi:DDE superfamily endonuclease